MKILFLATLILASHFLHAQYEIKGQILNNQGASVPGIGVQVLRAGNNSPITVSLTDTAGSFTCVLAKDGSYIVKIGSKFYRDTAIGVQLSSAKPIVYVGTVRLWPVTTELKKVTVTSLRPAIELKDDHIAYQPSADVTAHARPVAELLTRIPGISLDAGNRIQAKGQDAVQLLVNGRVVRMNAYDYLSQLNSNEVERIELYDHSARFSYVKAPMILNVVLKRATDRKRSWNVSLNGNTLPKINPSTDFILPAGKHRLYGRLSHDVLTMRSSGYRQRQMNGETSLQVFDNRLRHSMTNAQAGMEFLIDTSLTLTTELHLTRHNDALRSASSITTQGGEIRSLVTSSPIEKEMNAVLSLRKDLKQKGYRSLDASFTQFNLLNRRVLPVSDDMELRRMNNGSFTARAEWQLNMRNVKWLNGVAFQQTRIHDDTDTIGGISGRQVRFNTTSVTSFHELNLQLKSWNLVAGMNADWIETTIPSLKAPFHYKNFFVNPQLRITKKSGQSRLTLSYVRKYFVPGTFQLLGHYNQFEYRRSALGNYTLKPAVQNQMRFAFARTGKQISIVSEAYYDVTFDPILTVYTIGDSHITDMHVNLKKRSSLGYVFSFTWNASKLYSLTLNTDGRMNENIFYDKQQYLPWKKTWHVSTTAINRFIFSQKWNAAVTTSLYDLRTGLYRKSEPFVVMNLQSNYAVNKRLQLGFGVHDLLNRMKMQYTDNFLPGFMEEGYTKNRSRSFTFTCRYQLTKTNVVREKKTSTIKSFLSE